MNEYSNIAVQQWINASEPLQNLADSRHLSEKRHQILLAAFQKWGVENSSTCLRHF